MEYVILIEETQGGIYRTLLLFLIRYFQRFRNDVDDSIKY